MVRAAVIPALENVALWHERDISHSAVERFIAPGRDDHARLRAGAPAEVIERLVVYPEAMRANLDRLRRAGASRSSVLLALTQAGMSREDAYRAVQRHAMAVWNGGGDFQIACRADPEVTRHSKPRALEALFDLGDHMKHVDTIFRRVFTDDDDALNSFSPRGPRGRRNGVRGKPEIVSA